LCGRLCPDEYLCAGSCGVGKYYPSVRLGRLEAYVCDIQRKTYGLTVIDRPPQDAARVAVVGSGPAGLAAGEWLINHGRGVTVFDQNARPGGALAYSIPVSACHWRSWRTRSNTLSASASNLSPASASARISNLKTCSLPISRRSCSVPEPDWSGASTAGRGFKGRLARPGLLDADQSRAELSAIGRAGYDRDRSPGDYFRTGTFGRRLRPHLHSPWRRQVICLFSGRRWTYCVAWKTGLPPRKRE